MGRLPVHLEIKCCGPSLQTRWRPPSQDSYRPISLVSCASKIFEHMIHSRIAPYIFPQLDWCQGGFRWGADVMACSPCDSLRLPCNTHTLVALIDTKKAFDSCWVEAKLLRLPDIGVSGRMWHGIANFYRGTHSQVRIGESSSQCWVDSGIAQGRVLSPLLCDLLVDSLAPSLRSAVPVVRLVCFDVSHLVTPMTWSFRLSHKQTSKLLLMWLVRAWGVRWRLPFSHGPNKSASIVIWANSLLSNVSRPSRWQSCSVQTFGRSFSILILVGALMSITDVLAETACSTRSPRRQFFLFRLRHPRPVQCLLRVGMCWRQLLGLPRASPLAAVHWELGIGDALRIVFGRSLSLFGRLCAMDVHCPRLLVRASVFRLSVNVSGTWACWCASALRALSIQHPGAFGVSVGSQPSSVARWFAGAVTLCLEHDFRHKLAAMVCELHGVCVDISADPRPLVAASPLRVPTPQRHLSLISAFM